MSNFDLTSFFSAIPPQLATLIIAILPIVELRGSIPIALGVYQLSPISAFFWSVVGNILPIYFILEFLEPFSGFLRKKSRLAEKFFSWLFLRTRRKFEGGYLRYGLLALTIFVAIPLPGTGAWTGAIAAFLFGIPKKFAFFAISLGVVISGITVILISQGVITIF